MYQKAPLPKTVPSANRVTSAVSEPVSPTKAPVVVENQPYAKIRRLIDAAKYDEAAKLARSHSDPPTRNALAVCLMRQGRAEEAVRIYRAFVLDHTGLFLREQVPTVYKANFALALMLSGNVMGGINILEELGNDNHPSVEKLRETATAWKAQLSFLQKLGMKFGLEPNHPFQPAGPIGELV